MDTTSNILIVDDEEVVRLSHLRTLNSDHYNAVAVLNGKQALRAMEQRAFDVVLLDLRMPDMDGLSVLKAIKRRWPESQVIIITGYPSIDTAKEAVRLGAYDYLAKPVGPDEVIKTATAAIMEKKWTLRTSRAVRDQGQHFKYRYPWEH